ncbi:MerR family DNA-binding transcriptional regulator [Micromonospora sp. M12]
MARVDVAPEDRLRAVDLAATVGISVQQVRNYVELGVLPPTRRTASGYRIFTTEHARALGVARRLAEGTAGAVPGRSWRRCTRATCRRRSLRSTAATPSWTGNAPRSVGCSAPSRRCWPARRGLGPRPSRRPHRRGRRAGRGPDLAAAPVGGARPVAAGRTPAPTTGCTTRRSYAARRSSHCCVGARTLRDHRGGAGRTADHRQPAAGPRRACPSRAGAAHPQPASAARQCRPARLPERSRRRGLTGSRPAGPSS